MAYIGNSPTEQLYTSFAEKYSGTGSATTFNLSRTVNSVNDIEVVVAGSQQNPFTQYSISANGAQVIFTSAPAAGTDNIVVTYRNYVLTTFVPEDGTVTSAAIQGNAVTAAKIADNVITGSKLVANTITSREIADGQVRANNLASTAVTPGTYGGAEKIPVVVVDQQGRLTSAANVTIQQPLPNILMLSGM